MHFSLFLTTRSTDPSQDRAIMHAMIEHAKEGERLGFEAIFQPDHHFTGYAPQSSDPFMFAAYLAGQLKSMHFGFSVQTVPLHHPVRFAERLALLDQLTDGRLLVGVGSGTTPEESIGFGVNFQDTSRISVENLEIIEKLWRKKARGRTGHLRYRRLQRRRGVPDQPRPLHAAGPHHDVGRGPAQQRGTLRVPRAAGLHPQLRTAA